MIENTSAVGELPSKVRKYAIYLLVMAGLGGLLYGIDVGVIAAALPYIEKTSSYTKQQLSFVVAAVLTPPDVISQLMMAIPLCLLYELGLFMARFVGRRPPAETPAGVPAQAAPAPEAAPAAAAESWQPASDDEMAQVVADLNRRKPD